MKCISRDGQKVVPFLSTEEIRNLTNKEPHISEFFLRGLTNPVKNVAFEGTKFIRACIWANSIVHTLAPHFRIHLNIILRYVYGALSVYNQRKDKKQREIALALASEVHKHPKNPGTRRVHVAQPLGTTTHFSCPRFMDPWLNSALSNQSITYYSVRHMTLCSISHTVSPWIQQNVNMVLQ